jgi:hypothetical protein
VRYVTEGLKTVLLCVTLGDSVVLQGPLLKRGKVIKSWRDRYLRIIDDYRLGFMLEHFKRGKGSNPVGEKRGVVSV